jgi:hypothetical protein
MEDKISNQDETANSIKGAVSGSAITDADKALAILKAFHEIAHNSEKNEGLTITKDWDINTLTIETKEGHNHFGQMNCEDEKGFSILLNEIYRHYVR